MPSSSCSRLLGFDTGAFCAYARRAPPERVARRRLPCCCCSLLAVAAAAAVAAALLLWPLPCCCGLRRHLRGRHLNVEGLRGRLGPAAGRTCTRVLCPCSARAGCLPPVLLRSLRHLRELLGTGGPCGLLGPLRRGRLLEIGRLLDFAAFSRAVLCGLLACRPVRCPACLAAPSATTPGALLMCGVGSYGPASWSPAVPPTPHSLLCRR